MQDYSNSIALAMELLQSRTKPSMHLLVLSIGLFIKNHDTIWLTLCLYSGRLFIMN